MRAARVLPPTCSNTAPLCAHDFLVCVCVCVRVCVRVCTHTYACLLQDRAPVRWPFAGALEVFKVLRLEEVEDNVEEEVEAWRMSAGGGASCRRSTEAMSESREDAIVARVCRCSLVAKYSSMRTHMY